MKNATVFLFFVTIFSSLLAADEWVHPVERDYYSDNKQFVGHVTPAKGDAKAKIEVFRTDGAERIGLWHCALGNEGAPGYVFLTDDGRHVATVNENNSREHGGMGDYVVAFYDKNGLIKNYSLEEILHYTGPPHSLGFTKESRRLVSRSMSGRGWATMPMFFDKYEGKLHFCVWLYGGKYFLAWDAATGEEIKPTNALKSRWNEKGRRWALSEGLKSRSYGLAVDFLLMLKRPEDRKALEALVNQRAKFYTHAAHDSKSETKKFVRLEAICPKRAEAARALLRWDKETSENAKSAQKQRCFGIVSGTIHLPEAPAPDKSQLCIYLIPGDNVPENWHKSVPVHRLTQYFWKYAYHNVEWPGKDIPFRIHNVTPGEYTVKAVWDKGARTFGNDYIKGPPQKGDFQNKIEPTIIVAVGRTTDGIEIDCTEKVLNGAD